MVDFYLPRVGPQSTTSTRRGAGPAAFGAGVGEAVKRAGDRQLQQDLRSAQLDDDLEEQYQATEAGKALAGFGAEMDAAATTARETMPAGGAGHTEQLLEGFDKRSEEVLGGITHGRVRERTAVQIEQMRARIAGQEGAVEAGARVRKFGADVEEQVRVSANRVRMGGDVAVFGEALDQFETTIAGLKVPDEDKRALAASGRDRLARSLVEGLPPEQAKAVLEGGSLASYLKPETLDVLLNANGVELRRLDHQRAAQAAMGEAQLRERVNIFKQGLEAGNEPDGADFDALIGEAKALGLDPVVTDLTLAKNDGMIRRETRDWGEPKWQKEIGALLSKGDKRNAEEDIRLKTLERLRPAAVKRINSNPHEAAAEAGTPPPQVDVFGAATRGEIDGLRAWAKAYRQTAGLNYTPFLNPQQNDAAQARIREGAAGALAVAGELREKFGVGDAAEILRQVDPGNADLKLMVGLPPATAQRYARGIDALKRNKALYDDEAAREVFYDEGFAAAIPQELKTPIFEAAKNIAAGTADWVGNAELQGDNFRNTFKAALHRAAGQLVGGVDGKGGFARWNERMIWLPPELGGREVATRISRASPGQWSHAGGGKPYYRGTDGKLTPVPEGWFARIKQAPLVSIAPGVYRPLGRDGRPLARADGSPWQFDVRRLP